MKRLKLSGDKRIHKSEIKVKHLNTDNIDHIMTKDVFTCFEYDSINEVAKKMEEHNISGLPVINRDNQVIGNITTTHLSNLFDFE